MRMTRPVALVLVLVGALVATARAEVDVEVPASFKAKGTLDSSESETFRFRAVKGTTLTLSATPAKKSGLLLDVQLVGTGGTVAIPPEFVVSAAGKVAWKAFPLPATDDYRLVLSGEGTGGYSLSLKAKVKTAWTSTLAISGSPTVHFLFSAPTGSTIALSAKPAKGSPVVARFGNLLSPGASVDLSMAGKKTATGQAATVGPLATGGDCDLTVVNDAGAGDVVVTAKVKPPKTRPGKLDLRGTALGRPSGGETLVSRVLGTEGGTVEAEDEDDDIFGASVTFASDALAGPTLVSVASSAAPPIADPDDQAAGPAVRLGPSGVIFESPALVNLPVDPSKIPADATIDDVRILIVEDNGSSRIALPSGVTADSVTVETDTFSVCIPIIVSGPPPLGISPGGDEFWLLEFSAQYSEGSTDSRGRTISAHVGELSFFGDGTLQVSQTVWGYSWQNSDSPPMSGQPIDSGLSQFSNGNDITLDWDYDASGQNIVLSGAPESLPTFRVSRDGRYIAGRHDASTLAQAEVQLGVRKNTAPLTVASLKGTWTSAYLEMDAGTTSGAGAAEGKATRGIGTFVFDGAGGCKVSFTERKPHFDPADSTFDHELSNGSLPDATYSIQPDGTVLVTHPPQEGDEGGIDLKVYPGAGLDVMLLTHPSFENEAAMGMVLVRQGTGLSRASLAGDFHGTSFALDPQSYDTPTQGGIAIADFTARDEGLTAVFDGGATASFSFDAHEVQRVQGQPDGVELSNEVDTATVNVTVTSQGKLSVGDSNGKIVGTVSPDAQFVVAVTDIANAGAEYAIFFAFRAPPDKTP